MANTVATVNSGGDELVIMLFRPRSDEVFYRDLLPTLVSTLAAKLTEQGSRLVYPYSRDAPVLPVGNAFTFYNPGLREERQVLEAIDRARVDAELNGRIAARRNSTEFTNLLLAEDVTILYEPITNVTTREILGYEGLARGPWDSDLHTPAALFDMAEEAGFLFELIRPLVGIIQKMPDISYIHHMGYFKSLELKKTL